VNARAVRTASALVSTVPLGAARAMGRLGGRIAHRRWDGRRAMATRHMARVLNGDPGEVDAGVEQAVRLAFERYGVYMAETLWLRERRVAEVQRRLVVAGAEHYAAALERGRGMVLALPHIGNWEFAAAYALEVGTRLVAVAEDLADAEATRWFVRMRAQLGIEVELAGGGRALLRRLAEVLEGNGAVALVSDRDVTGGGVPVEFFGEVTLLPSGPASLARTTGAALLPVACYLTESGHRAVIGPPVPVPATDDRRADVEGATTALAGAFEQLIRDDPAQWHLLQPQWPSDPGWRWGPVT
jgi:phosphatidylinositol dimannoside acyltransferase